MFYKMIENKCREWYHSEECTVHSLVEYIEKTGKMRDAQVEAIKLYLFLKIGCGCKPLELLFRHGYFNSINLNDVELSTTTRTYLEENPAAAALFEYALLTNDRGEQVSKGIEKQIKKDPSSIDYHAFFQAVFFNVSKPQYSLQDTKKFSIDPTDICAIPSDLIHDDRIWKIAMWGSPRDLELIDRIQSTYPSLETFLSSHGMQNAEGYKRGNRKQIYNGFNTIPIVDSDSFSPFYIPESRLERNEDNTFERFCQNNLSVFQAPHLVLKQSHRKGRFYAAVLDYDAIFSHSFLGISGNKDILKYLCLIINSKLFSYYHLLTSRTWMVERDALEAGDIRTIPIPEPSETILSKAVELFGYIMQSGDESGIDAFVFDLYRLRDYEVRLVLDALDYIYNYFDKKAKSVAFAKPTREVYKRYYSTLMDVLNNSLGQPFSPSASFYIGESPLSVLMLSVDTPEETLRFFDNCELTEQCLTQLDSLLTEKRHNIYIRRNVRVYGDDAIYIIKPKQEKYWNFSSACRDADEIFSDIMKARG